MWISKEESGIVSSTLKPKMDKTRKAHESLLDEAITLQVMRHLLEQQSLKCICLFLYVNVMLQARAVLKASSHCQRISQFVCNCT